MELSIEAKIKKNEKCAEHYEDKVKRTKRELKQAIDRGDPVDKLKEDIEISKRLSKAARDRVNKLKN